jgi:tetratricopeptide (TPR) repeat protein
VTISRPQLRDSYEGILGQAQMAQRAGNVESAIHLYRRLFERLARLNEQLLDRRPDLRTMYLQAGQELIELLRSEGRYAEAYQAKSRLAAAHPHLADEWRSDLATLRIAKGEVDAGLGELRTWAEQDAGEPRGWLKLGTEARIEGRFTESEVALNLALETCSTDQDLADTHIQRFRLFKDMGKFDDAIAAWEEAVMHDPDKAVSVQQVYTMLTDAGRYSQAREYVKRDPNPLRAGLQQGLIASLTGDTTRAGEEWRAVAQRDPLEFENGHDCWTEAVLRLGDPEPALEGLQELLAEGPTPRLLTLSGIAWAMRGDAELAGALFQRTINLLRKHRPPKQKLDSADWRILDSLVTDDEIKALLKPYFAVVETVWA